MGILSTPAFRSHCRLRRVESTCLFVCLSDARMPVIIELLCREKTIGFVILNVNVNVRGEEEGGTFK